MTKKTLPQVLSRCVYPHLRYLSNRSFPNFYKPLPQSESWCLSFHIKIRFHSLTNYTHFHIFRRTRSYLYCIMSRTAITPTKDPTKELCLSFAQTNHFTCTSTNVIYCITCTLCKKLYIGETGRRLGDRFREHLRDVEKDDKNASKPVARHFNLPNHSKQHMVVCGLSLHQGSTESRKTQEQKFIFQIGTLNPHGINERFSFN